MFIFRDFAYHAQHRNELPDATPTRFLIRHTTATFPAAFYRYRFPFSTACTGITRFVLRPAAASRRPIVSHAPGATTSATMTCRARVRPPRPRDQRNDGDDDDGNDSRPQHFRVSSDRRSTPPRVLVIPFSHRREITPSRETCTFTRRRIIYYIRPTGRPQKNTSAGFEVARFSYFLLNEVCSERMTPLPTKATCALSG